jgi:hypothetical protein
MKNVAISRSSRSSKAPTWLGEVYERRRRRTVRLVELSITVLTGAGERVSLAAVARVSKTVDPADPDGISESAILHNEEAYALYRQHADRKRQTSRKPSPNRGSDIGDDKRIPVSADRDRGRARQRYLHASKADLVERLLLAEQAYANMEARWLRTADDLLVWIIVLDRLLAGAESEWTLRTL